MQDHTPMEMDERVATERILNRMTDPKQIEQRRLKKQEAKRVENVKNKHTL
jgi:hypothetical protein